MVCLRSAAEVGGLEVLSRECSGIHDMSEKPILTGGKGCSLGWHSWSEFRKGVGGNEESKGSGRLGLGSGFNIL